MSYSFSTSKKLCFQHVILVFNFNFFSTRKLPTRLHGPSLLDVFSIDALRS